MALPAITPMLKLANQNVKILHIESTTACNAACPQCAREVDLTFDKKNLSHLTVEQIKNLIDVDTIKNLDKMFMCGDYGDPAAGRHTLEIFRYFRKINPNIILGMNTNGGIRNSNWWKELAVILNQPNDYVVFSIDGLEDTNHIYRVNTDWNKIIANAKEFIKNNGQAHWEMLVFEHNEHQVDLAQQLAKDLGFSWFRIKVSRRFESYPIAFLNPPKSWQDVARISGNIDCQAIKDQSLYISASGILYPCCWLGINTEYTLNKFDAVRSSWDSESPNFICANTCSGNQSGNNFTNQWRKEIALK